MKKEYVTSESEAIANSFDAAAAFNTEGFAEFLAKYSDAETFDVADTVTLETRYRAFMNKNEAANGLGEVLENELAGHELGIAFGDEAIEQHVGERFDSLAFENPEKVNEIAEALEIFRDINSDMAAAKAEIERLQGEGDLEAMLEELKKKQETLETASEAVGTFAGLSKLSVSFAAAYEKFAFSYSVEYAENWLKNNEGDSPVRTRAEMEAFIKENSSAREKNDARLALEDYSIKFNKGSIEAAIEQTEKEIEDLAARIETIEDLELRQAGNRARFAEIKQLLMLGVGTNEELKKVAMDKALDRLDALIVTDPEEAQLYFEKMRDVSVNNTFGLDYLNGKQEEVQKMLEEKIGGRLADDMRKAIEKTSFGNKAYDKLVASLKNYVGKLKVGSKEGDAARAFVLETLKTLGAEISAKDKARGLLVRFMHVKLQNA